LSKRPCSCRTEATSGKHGIQHPGLLPFKMTASTICTIAPQAYQQDPMNSMSQSFPTCGGSGRIETGSIKYLLYVWAPRLLVCVLSSDEHARRMTSRLGLKSRSSQIVQFQPCCRILPQQHPHLVQTRFCACSSSWNCGHTCYTAMTMVTSQHGKL